MAECLVLHILRDAKPATSSLVHDLRWNAELVDLLPTEFAIIISSESERAAQEAAKRGENWHAFDPSIHAREKGTDEVIVIGDGFREQLIVWGRGDFDNNGTEDLLVQTFDTITEGTYRNTRLYLLGRKLGQQSLSVVRRLL